MQEKLVGLFDNAVVADDVVQDLLRNGFEKSAIRVFHRDGESPLPSSDAGNGHPAGASYLGEGMLAGLRNFLGDIGLIDAHSGERFQDDVSNYYDQGVRQGGRLISVQANTYMIERAREIMRTHHVIDMKERSASGQGSDLSSAVEADDERRFERPVREAEMEVIGERSSGVPGYARGTTQDAAWQGNERRRGRDRRLHGDRRAGGGQSMSADMLGR